MLRLHFLQHWFNLSDPAAEEALYDSLSMRCFVGIDLGREPVPDETTILNFRRLLERHELGKPLFERVNEHLAVREMKVAGGTIVDATTTPRCRYPRLIKSLAFGACARITCFLTAVGLVAVNPR